MKVSYGCLNVLMWYLNQNELNMPLNAVYNDFHNFEITYYVYQYLKEKKASKAGNLEIMYSG